MLTFMNMTGFRASIEQAIHARQFTKAILNTVMEPLVVLNAELRVQTANRAFFTMFHVSREEACGSLFAELKYHRWELPNLWTLLKDFLAGKNHFPPLELDHDFPALGRRTVLLTARRLDDLDHHDLILLTFCDITAQKQVEETRAQLYALSMAVNHAEALPELYDKALEAISRSLKADRASILLFDAENVMRFRAWRGLSEGYCRAVEGHSPWGADDHAPDPILISNIAEWHVDEPLKEVIHSEGIGALAF